MNWRNFSILGVGLVGLLMNGWMLSQETISVTGQEDDLVNDEVRDPLAGISYVSRHRDKHLRSFGLPDNLRSKTIKKIQWLEKNSKERIMKWLHEDSASMGAVFCAGGMTQRYGALAVLVKNDSDIRHTIKPKSLNELAEQSWYDPVSSEQVYRFLEEATDRHEDATVMGVAAILLSRESDVLKTRSPWGSSWTGGWSLEDVLDSDETITRDLVNYFSMMYYITELANQKGADGICQ